MSKAEEFKRNIEIKAKLADEKEFNEKVIIAKTIAETKEFSFNMTFSLMCQMVDWSCDMKYVSFVFV